MILIMFFLHVSHMGNCFEPRESRSSVSDEHVSQRKW